MTIIHRTTLCVALCGALFSAQAGDLSTASKQATPTARFTPDSFRKETKFSRFIVKTRGTAKAETVLAAAAQRVGVRQSSSAMLSTKRIRALGRGATLVRTSRALSVAESDTLLAQLRADPNVAWAQPDTMKYRMDTVPNDTHFATLQWDYTHAVGGIGAPKAWDTTQGAGVVVAVLDTGYVDHADLSENIVPG